MAGLLVAAALVLNGVTAGILLGSVVGPVPLLLAATPSGYVRGKQFLTPRYDPAMPILVLTNIVVDVAVVVTADTTGARSAFAAAIVLLLAMVWISVAKNVPVNKWEQTLDPDALPADWDARDPRPIWARWHVARTVLLTAALLVTVAGAALY